MRADSSPKARQNAGRPIIAAGMAIPAARDVTRTFTCVEVARTEAQPPLQIGADFIARSSISRDWHVSGRCQQLTLTKHRFGANCRRGGFLTVPFPLGARAHPNTPASLGPPFHFPQSKDGGPSRPVCVTNRHNLRDELS